MKATIFVLLMSIGTLVNQANAQEKESTSDRDLEVDGATALYLSVEGMSCQEGCANGIDNMLRQQKGVVKSKTTQATSTSVIWYDQKLISQKELISLIRDRGFKAKKKRRYKEGG